MSKDKAEGDAELFTSPRLAELGAKLRTPAKVRRPPEVIEYEALEFMNSPRRLRQKVVSSTTEQEDTDSNVVRTQIFPVIICPAKNPPGPPYPPESEKGSPGIENRKPENTVAKTILNKRKSTEGKN